MIRTHLQNQLREIYSNASSPGGLRGAEALYQEAKKVLPNLTKKQVSDFIITQSSYTKSRQFRPVKRYRRVMTDHINYLWQIDLMDFSAPRYVRANRPFRFCLTIIDTFSKRLKTFKLKTKKKEEVKDILIRLLLPRETRPWNIQADEGNEFVNNLFKGQLALMKPPITLYNTSSILKASIVERVQRTLKGRLGKYWEEPGVRKYRWVDILPEITKSYNNSYHRSIGMTPNEVNAQNEKMVYRRLYPKPNRGDPTYPKYMKQKRSNFRHAKLLKKKFKIGDLVRHIDKKKLEKKAKGMTKESDPNFTDEVFRIHEIRDPMQKVFRSYDQEPITFKLMSLGGVKIKGSFYGSQIQKVLQ